MLLWYKKGVAIIFQAFTMGTIQINHKRYKAMANNFDMNSAGVNIELSCYYDSDLARLWFEGDFEVIRYSSYSARALLLYTEGGEFSDFERDIIIEETRENFIEVFKLLACDYYEGQVKQALEDFTTRYGPTRSATVQDLKDFTEELSSLENMLELLSSVGEPNFIEVGATGYCQKDYYTVIVPKESIAYKSDGFDFDKMIYDAPLHIRLTVDGEEYYIDEQLKDVYDYDTGEVLDMAGKLLEDHPKKLYILDWLEDNLPQHPESY